MSFPKNSRYQPGDFVEVYSERGNRVYDNITWEVVDTLKIRDKGKDSYRIYTIRGTWTEKIMRGRRVVERSRTTYRQYRASRLRKAKVTA